MATDPAMMGMEAMKDGNLSMAIGKLFLMLGDQQNQKKNKLPPLPKARVPGATGLDRDWEKFAKALIKNSSDE